MFSTGILAAQGNDLTGAIRTSTEACLVSNVGDISFGARLSTFESD
jgi:hypothetical protein